ncbi:MAG: rRNA (pseudouridine1915-N3)-methyltransferase [Chthoniobacter sp.]|jgi:23S rRNA (pseudouridine1915-N3)-methyltransferase|nr:rRNA (pseudouridine1915-N3)-methyltransferase [Chthoniobacter sp.]
MRWHIFVIGKPKLEFARLGVEEYAARMKPFAPASIEYLKATSRAGESLALLERSKGMFRIVLDERGLEVTSRAFAQKISEWEVHGPRDLALLIGGADGHVDELRQAAGWLWSLSRLTLQHEMALIVALEQLYRAYTIKTGMPYHRD